MRIATAAHVAILVPYFGCLAREEMPFVQDPRGIATVGLIGLLVAVAAWGLRFETRFGKVMLGAIVLTAGLGFAALFVGVEGSAALLAVFIGAVVTVWLAETLFAVGMVHRTGWRPGDRRAGRNPLPARTPDLRGSVLRSRPRLDLPTGTATPSPALRWRRSSWERSSR